MQAWPSNKVPRFDTLVLALLAGVTVVLVRAQSNASPTVLTIRATVEIILLTAFAVTTRYRVQSRQQALRVVVVLTTVGVLYPFAAEFVLRLFMGGSEPLELLMLSSMLAAAIVLATFSVLPRLGGTAVLLCSFLMLFTVVMGGSYVLLMQALAGVFGVCALWWLMGAYWEGLAGASVARNVQRKIPIRLTVLGGTLIVLIAVTCLAAATGTSSTIALAGFMPTSGGSQWYDPQAQSGVGNGDALVAGTEQAQSFGPVESELFADSDMPSLYDVFNDMIGEPPKKKQQRNIALSSNDVQGNDQRMAVSQKSGREFSAVRRKVQRRKRTLEDRKAPAMMYVVGRTPLHLALERFDSFDGRTWSVSTPRTTATERKPSLPITTSNGKPWAQVMKDGASTLHRGWEPHAIKIINLKTNRIPSPPQLSAVHIDRVDKEDFYGWAEDGTVYMPVRKSIPQLTVIRVRSQGVQLQQLRDSSTHLPDWPTERLAEDHLARRRLEEWTRGIAPGWRQVEAVVARLREDFTVDPQTHAPADCHDVVTHFLTARRGPGYLFATTAAVMIRELGYQTRLTGGFYARTERFDHRAGQTTVLAEDAHVWVEVRASGAWLTVEPTPGYEPPREYLSWSQQAALLGWELCRWAYHNAFWLLLGAAATVLLWVTRKRCLDAVFAAVFYLAGCGSSRRRVLWTLRLLEWRGWLAGNARRRTDALHTWYGSLAPVLSADGSHCLHELLQHAERSLYSPHNASGADDAPSPEINQICSAVARHISVACFEQAGPRMTRRPLPA